MGLLDELKNEAASLKSKEQLEQERREMLERRLRDEIAPRMQALFQYLLELTKQLNYVKPDARAAYEVEGYGTIEGLLQQEYFLTDFVEGKFAFLFTCVADRKHVFELDSPPAIERQKNYFMDHGLKYYCKELKNDRYEVYKATFVFQEEVPVKLEFSANVEENAIDMTARNYAKLGREAITFPMAAMDDSFHDELGKFVLRRANNLAERRLQRISDEQREALRRMVEEEKRQREAELARHREEEQARQAAAANGNGKGGLFGLFKKK